MEGRLIVADGPLTILTDLYSDPVAEELKERWPRHQLNIRYLRKQEGKWSSSAHDPLMQATLLDPDVSEVLVDGGIKFRYAFLQQGWKLTTHFSRDVIGKSFWIRFIGRASSSRSAQVFYLREFYKRVSPWIFLCLYARHLSTEASCNEKSTIVFLALNPFDDWIVDCLRDVYASIVVGRRSSDAKAFRIASVDLIKRFQRRWKRLRSKHLKAVKEETVSANDRPVAVEVCWGLHDPEEAHSDLFWLPRSGITDDQVMVYFDRSDRPPSEKALETIRKRGWQPFVLSRQLESRTDAVRMSLYALKVVGWRMLLMVLAYPLWVLEHPLRRRTFRWCWTRTLASLVRVTFWHHIFTGYRVRVHSNHSDQACLHHAVQTIALEWGGGINLHTTFSFDYGPSKMKGAYATPFDVFFAWGAYIAGIVSTCDLAGITTLITCGFPFDYLFKGAGRRAGGVRRELEARGARRIISFFDTAFNKMTQSPQGEAQHIYQALLTEVTKNREFGLVLKPKNIWEEAKAAIPEELLKQALATGRCKLLVRHSYSEPPISPADAALASDLAVGCPISSAVIEAVLAGVPGVHMDLAKEPGHWFYEVDSEKFVFNDLDQAMETIRRWIRNPADEPKLGDHSQVLDGIDPFRDGKAAQRIGQYMAWLLEGFKEGLSRDGVVRQATHRYAEEYGAQHVRLAPRLCAKGIHRHRYSPRPTVGRSKAVERGEFGELTQRVGHASSRQSPQFN